MKGIAKTKVLLPLAALLLAACGNLPGLQPKPFTGALDLASPLQTVAPGGQSRCGRPSTTPGWPP
ncbi:hypothetical protein [Thermus aquaticus]|uniref:Lipoprotein n=1 Tax=Thermus aquaticus (strain ATCC BAA-2747 / Y51MC23) TaxID=498848 RepID=A0ABM5VNC6_THEA5|nr:hypothetical protein [Thermus aquaticus]ALJ91662.1 hypothetical protein TO73_1830 [Thermus aquaticus Y51MC23]